MATQDPNLITPPPPPAGTPMLTPAEALAAQLAASQPGAPPAPPTTTLPGSTSAAATIPAQAASGIPMKVPTQSALSQNAQNAQSNPQNSDNPPPVEGSEPPMPKVSSSTKTAGANAPVPMPDPDQDFYNSMTQALSQSQSQQQQSPQSQGNPITQGIMEFLPAALKNVAPVHGLLNLLGGYPQANGNPNVNGPIGANSTQAVTPQDTAYNAATQNLNQDLANLRNAPLNPLFQKRVAIDEVQQAQSGAQRDVNLQTQSVIGYGSPADTQTFIDKGIHAGAIVQATKDFDEALKSGTPDEIATAVGALVKQGNLSDGIGRLQNGASLMTAITTGKGITDWLTNPDHAADAKQFQGMLKATYNEAANEAQDTDRTGRALWRNQIPQIQGPNGQTIDDQASKEYRSLKGYAPTFGEPEGGLPDKKEIFDNIDKLNDPDWYNSFNNQGLRQIESQGAASAAAKAATAAGALESKKRISDAGIGAPTPTPPGVKSKQL